MPNVFPILVSAPTAARSTAKLMKTGQTTSYRTGDDGDLERGRNVDFFTLAENNPFGNTNRFTDELGGQDYANNWIIDWSTYDGSTALGWYRIQNDSNVVWDDAVSNSLGTFGTFANCRLPNVNELFSIYATWSLTRGFSYSPFNLPADNRRYWTSTTVVAVPTVAYHVASQTGIGIAVSVKSTLYDFIVCRDFVVTGTILT